VPLPVLYGFLQCFSLSTVQPNVNFTQKSCFLFFIFDLYALIVINKGDLEGSTGFGFAHDKFGIFSTFSAFLEMVLSEITLARLNSCNALSHSRVLVVRLSFTIDGVAVPDSYDS
jgi:hypothetical protein